MQYPLYLVVGPTASGKTAFSILLAKRLKAEIISGDSRQFYREINIGTAKPTIDQLEAVPHHFIDSLSVHEDFSAGDFAEQALARIQSLHDQGKPVVVCGGSGLYLDALVYGFDEIPEVDKSVRDKLRKVYEQKGLAWLQAEVERLDPEYFLSADKQNPQRLLRALEVCISSGQAFSTFRKKNKNPRPFYPVWIGIEKERSLLRDHIALRVVEMLEAGLEQEAVQWKTFFHLEAFRTIGYREWIPYFDGQETREQVIQKIIDHSRQYAKRQMTWWRRNPEIHWISGKESDIDTLISDGIILLP